MIYNKDKPPKCWIYSDKDLIFYSKHCYKIEYEFTYKFKCKLVQMPSNKIKEGPDNLVEKISWIKLY